jgi:hypothetical protein
MSVIFSEIPRLDHIAIGVTSLAEAETNYKEQLGFALFLRGRHEQYGTENSGACITEIPLGDGTKIELLQPLSSDKSNDGILFRQSLYQISKA